MHCSLFFFPLEIQVTPKSLNIVFSLYVKEIPLMDISRAEPYKVTMNFARIFGSGAFFGWWGWFHNQELGRFMVYATNLDHVFLIEAGKGKNMSFHAVIRKPCAAKSGTPYIQNRLIQNL